MYNYLQYFVEAPSITFFLFKVLTGVSNVLKVKEEQVGPLNNEHNHIVNTDVHRCKNWRH